jgi:hypothetical protein
MKDRLADGVARVRERVDALRGRETGGDRYVLLPAGAGRRRRIAEVSTVAGVVVIVLAFVGVTVALRPSSSAQPDGPGLPAPTEAVSSLVGSPSASVPSTSVPVPTGPGAPVNTGRFTPTATATGTGCASPTATPTTRASVSSPPRTTPPRTTVPSTPTATPTPSATVSPTPTETATTDPADPGDT